jgi:signal transduction histidine kinase
MFGGIVGMAAALVVAAVLWSSLYRPLSRVTAGVRAVARGDFEERVPERGPSEVKALARDVNAMSGAVQASQRTLRDFLANVSHELKTPLTSIHGFALALQDGTLDTPKAQQRAVRVIDVESRRVLQLVADLLDLSRIESGQERMELGDVSVEELLEHVQDLFALKAGESDITMEVDPGRELIARADFERISQVLSNLLDNALRHAPRGTKVFVRAEPEGGMARISIQDAGRGIPSEDLPHVFDRFYRSAAETAGSGAGLGLAIARQIVLAHGGQIGVETPPQGGTRFWFSLPLSAHPTEGQSW